MRRFFEKNSIYHIYNRGVVKQKIFKNLKDYQRFLFLLFTANSVEPIRLRVTTSESVFQCLRGDTYVTVLAYCLMPNHFHLVLKENIDGGIGKFMQKLQMGYAKYFNLKYDGSGAVFQGAYKVRLINSEKYLSVIFLYVHSNPRDLHEIETYKDLVDYEFSSFGEYQDNINTTTRMQSVVIDKDFGFEVWPNVQEMNNFLKNNNMSTSDVDMLGF